MQSIIKSHNRQVSVSGFSLIEVLVALAIVAIAFLAIGSQFDRQVTVFERNRDRLLAQWAASNQAVLLEVTGVWPNAGSSDEEVPLGGRIWKIHREVIETPNPSIRRVDYHLASDSGQRLGRYVWYLNRSGR